MLSVGEAKGKDIGGQREGEGETEGGLDGKHPKAIPGKE